MKLKELIARLKKEDPNREIPIGFCSPHSHRGDYSELAFRIDIDTTIRGLLLAAEYAVDRDFEGYKGEIYRMTLETECYLTPFSESLSGIKIDEALLSKLLEKDDEKHNNLRDREWTATDHVCVDVAEERLRQIDECQLDNEQTFYLDNWHEVIADHSAWARRCLVNRRYKEARERYIQVAAIAVAAVEAIDRMMNDE